MPTLVGIRRQWLKFHKPVHSAKHWTDVESVSRLWLLPNLGDKRMDRITQADVYRVRARMLRAGPAPVTVNDMLKILKLLVRFAVKLGHLDALPFRIEFLKVQRKPRPVLPAPRVTEFLAAMDREARNPQVRLMLRVMIGLGLRESEVRGMRWAWLDAEHRTYTVGQAKGKEARILPVPGWLWSALQDLAKSRGPWVFPAADGKPHRAQVCKKPLGRVCAKLGLGHVTHHRLRATFASLHAQVGTPITEIQEMLGHKNLATTMIRNVSTTLRQKVA